MKLQQQFTCKIEPIFEINLLPGFFEAKHNTLCYLYRGREHFNLPYLLLDYLSVLTRIPLSVNMYMASRRQNGGLFVSHLVGQIEE